MTTDELGDRTHEHASSEERIVHATLMLIQQHGLGSVTMSQIAETAGVARQTLYNHHSGIDSIIVTTLQQHNEESLKSLHLSLRTAATPTESIEQLARHFVIVGSQAHGTPDLRDGLSADARAVLDSYRDGVNEIVQDVLRQGIDTGEFRNNIDLSIDTHLVHATLEMLQDLAARTPNNAATISTTGTRTIISALKPRSETHP